MGLSRPIWGYLGLYKAAWGYTGFQRVWGGSASGLRRGGDVGVAAGSSSWSGCGLTPPTNTHGSIYPYEITVFFVGFLRGLHICFQGFRV